MVYFHLNYQVHALYASINVGAIFNDIKNHKRHVRNIKMSRPQQYIWVETENVVVFK